MPTDKQDPLKTLLEQQQALFKQWIEKQSSSVPDGGHLSSADPARAAAILSSQTAEYLNFSKTLLSQLKQCSDQAAVSGCFDLFKEHIQRQTGEALLKQWQLPENIAALFRTHSFHDDLLFENPYYNGLKSLLNFPSVGSTHELQQNTRDAIKLLLEYQEALQEYVNHYSDINQHAIGQLIESLTDGDKEVETFGELHDLWVDCYESSYSSVLYTSEYQKSHGRISNALMRLRKHAQDMRDIYFESTGLATRKGLDTALQRQHQLRKEMREVNRKIVSLQQDTQAHLFNEMCSTVNTLTEEIAELRKELAQLKSSQQKKQG